MYECRPKGPALEVGSIDDDWIATKMNFVIHRAVHHNIIRIVKPTRCTSVSNLFILEWHSTCFRRSFHHQEFEIVHTATSICQTDTAVCLLASRQRPSETCRVPF